MEYLSKIQNDQKKLGKQLQEIRIKNGIELVDIRRRDFVEAIERGDLLEVDGKFLIQHAHAIGCEIVAKDLEEVKSPVQSLLEQMGDLCRPRFICPSCNKQKEEWLDNKCEECTLKEFG